MADLTRDAILALPAGPELDALVAERVLGIPPERWLSVCREQGHRTDDYEYDPSDGDESGWCYMCGVSVCEAQKCPPRYSTDIAAAWVVVEHLRERWSLWVGPQSIGELWACEYTRSDQRQLFAFPGESDGPFVTAETAPLALCRAALLTPQEERTDG